MKPRYSVRALLAAVAAISLACSSGGSAPSPSPVDTDAGGAGGSPPAGEGRAEAGGGGADATTEAGGPSELACETSADCDDGAACNGREQCDAGVCVSGKPVECAPALVCVEESGGSCALTDTSPWIVYAADDDTPALTEIYAVKRDLVGTMEPAKLNDPLEPGFKNNRNGWSPDRRWFAFYFYSPAGQYHTEVLHFPEGLFPQRVLNVSGTSLEWAPSGDACSIIDASGAQIYEIVGPGELEPVLTVASGGPAWTRWSKRGELIVATQNKANGLRQLHRAFRSDKGWESVLLTTDLDLAQLDVSAATDEIVYELKGADGAPGPQYVIEMSVGSKPKLLAPGGASNYVHWAPDNNRYLLIQGTPTNTVKAFLGSGSLYSSTPIPIAPSLTLSWAGFASGNEILFYQPLGDGILDVRLLDPSKSNQYPSALVARMGTQDSVLYRLDADVIIAPERSTPTGDVELIAFRGAKHGFDQLDTIPAGEPFRLVALSPRGNYFVYSKGAEASEHTYYMDLRYPELWGYSPIQLPGEGRIRASQFDTSGTGLYYIRERPSGALEAEFVDLSGQVAAEPVKLSRKGRVQWIAPQN